jgi:2-(1,2-epoxy-1,2-dihydrophenyl)acetyl-CoA isomerase
MKVKSTSQGQASNAAERCVDLRKSVAMAAVETTRDGAVLTITLNRPDVLNAFNTEMHRVLAGALKEARDSEIRAVVVTGAGRGFCVGQDLTEFREASGDIGGHLRENYHPNVLAIRALEKPVIAVVNGPAAGAGLSFACACDLRLAADSASFVPAFINIGLVPDSGGTYFVTRILGPARAFEWLASGRKLTAAEAQTWGLVAEVVDADTLAARAAEVARQFAELPTLAIGMTKRLVDHAPTASLEEQLEREAQLQAAATQTSDFREGVAAFLERRPPRFTGA